MRRCGFVKTAWHKVIGNRINTISLLCNRTNTREANPSLNIGAPTNNAVTKLL